MIALRKKHPLTLVQAEAHESTRVQEPTRSRIFGWRNAARTRSLKSLAISDADFMRVSNATVREGESHRVWPPEVFQKFRMAEVITNNGMQHYVVRDTTVTRVTR
jgi:hypothetical protein